MALILKILVVAILTLVVLKLSVLFLMFLVILEILKVLLWVHCSPGSWHDASLDPDELQSVNGSDPNPDATYNPDPNGHDTLKKSNRSC